MQNGAASVIRTRDLTLTKGALYRWSYGSTAPWFTIGYNSLQESLKHALKLILASETSCVTCVSARPGNHPTHIWAIEVSKSDLPRFETWIDIFDLRNLRLLSVIFCAYRDVSDAA